VSETFRFQDVKSVYVQTPLEVRLRSGGVGDTRGLETTVAEALREHLRREFGWVSARSPLEADLVARFQLTDWESGAEGARVGGAVTLQPAKGGEEVFSASTVYPGRFGAGAIGPPLENLPNLFDSLFKPLKERR
jgi:hypothetical protein